jgi:hypothetical protein
MDGPGTTTPSSATRPTTAPAPHLPDQGRDQAHRGRDEMWRGFAAVLAYDYGRERHLGTAFICGNAEVAEWSFQEPGGDSACRLMHGRDIFEFAGDTIPRKAHSAKSLPTSGLGAKIPSPPGRAL